jgi:hypothetical protein
MNSSDILTDIKHQHDINKLSLNKIKNFGLFIITMDFAKDQLHALSLFQQ